VRQNLRQQFGLDDPVMVRYVRWFGSMVKGDWGFSFSSRVDVDKLIMQRLPVTLFVIGTSQLLALLIAIPVGVYAATRPYSVFDQVANTLAFVGFSLPTFFTGLLLHPALQHQARLAAVRLSSGLERDRACVVVGALQAVDHADHGARALPGRLVDALRALRGARRGAARLRHHRPRARGSTSAP
jgi:ABC-type dipeptide/oligopeptide/nickel transport system permease component